MKKRWVPTGHYPQVDVILRALKYDKTISTTESFMVTVTKNVTISSDFSF